MIFNDLLNGRATVRCPRPIVVVLAVLERSVNRHSHHANITEDNAVQRSNLDVPRGGQQEHRDFTVTRVALAVIDVRT